MWCGCTDGAGGVERAAEGGEAAAPAEEPAEVAVPADAPPAAAEVKAEWAPPRPSRARACARASWENAPRIMSSDIDDFRFSVF